MEKIYVDTLMPCLRNPKWRYNYSCHLFADNIDDLHIFAESLGLKKAWFQDDYRLPHYDLTKSKRIQAVKMGASEVSIKFTARRMRQAMKDFNLKSPKHKGV